MAGPKLGKSVSGLPLAAGATSRNLGPTFFSIAVSRLSFDWISSSITLLRSFVVSFFPRQKTPRKEFKVVNCATRSLWAYLTYIQMWQKSRRIGCVIPHCKLQRGSRNLSFDFFDISVHPTNCCCKIMNGTAARQNLMHSQSTRKLPTHFSDPNRSNLHLV